MIRKASVTAGLRCPPAGTETIKTWPGEQTPCNLNKRVLVLLRQQHELDD